MLDVLIGLITLYLVYGLACTAIVEAVAAKLSWRGKQLRNALDELLAGQLEADGNAADAFFMHPLIQSLSKGQNSLPSYISAPAFARTVRALLDPTGTAQSLQTLIDQLPGSDDSNRIKGLLRALAMDTQNDAVAFGKALESQFDLVMERATGWFKKNTQTLSLVAAAALVLATNFDTIAVVNRLTLDEQARAVLIKAAEQQLSANPPANDATAQPATNTGTAQNLAAQPAAQPLEGKELQLIIDLGQTLGLGWRSSDKSKKQPEKSDNWQTHLSKLVGLAISILAVSLGAPFWFDMLQRVMQLRSSIKPKAEEQKKPASS
ncbi:hypothetical protein LRS11_04800 [Pseudomonas sp. J452]|uniref:hypothetical protein n=1 Tax=Pseudomonas sp. J452 TaxID=2898441 RepID=UPI0021ADE12A|nr:hypothetical protein [Pseudomonas sp. J452]UUY09357.1 hypothetical protein LRS11_04800 [Pseudomonas sp. J452]